MRAGYGWASQIPRLAVIALRGYLRDAAQAPPRVEQSMTQVPPGIDDASVLRLPKRIPDYWPSDQLPAALGWPH